MENLSFWMLSMVGFSTFMIHNHHLMMMIISMETIMLAMLMKFIMNSSWSSQASLFFPMITTIVCMGGFSVSMVVSTTRNTGKDKTKMN